MKLWTYRGWRVRKYHEKIKFISFFIFYLPFLVGNGLYHYFNYQKAMDSPIVYGAISFFALLIPALFCLSFQKYLYEHTVFFGRLDNLRVASKFLLEGGYYYSKKGGQGKEKIKLPRVYLKRDKFGLDLTFILQGGKFQDRFINLGSTLEMMFDGDFMAKVFTKGYVTYTIILDHIRGRIHVNDVAVDKNGLRLMEDIWWDFNSQPHLLISGGTGGGKTVTIMSIIKGLAPFADIDICDPKKSDFVGLKDVPVFKGRVFFDKDTMVQCLEDNVKEMDLRYRAMTNHLEYRAGKRYSDYGLRPKFIIFDEWAAFMAELERDYKQSAAVMEALTQIILKGRQSGVFMILAMQRADGEFIKTALRDNFMKRLSVGHLEDSGYMMMYGDANRNKVFKKIDTINGKRVFGRGYIANAGEIAQEFYSPHVPFDEGYSFLDEFKKLEPLKEQELLVVDELLADEEIDELGEVALLLDEQLKRQNLASENDNLLSSAMSFDDQLDNKPKRTLDDFSKTLGRPTKTIRNLINLIESEGYRTFDKVEGRFVLSYEDEMLLETLFENKDSFDGSWKELLSLHFVED